MGRVLKNIIIIMVLYMLISTVYAYGTEGLVESRTMDITMLENGEVHIIDMISIKRAERDLEYQLPIHRKKVTDYSVMNAKHGLFVNRGEWDSTVLSTYKQGKIGTEVIGDETYLKWGIEQGDRLQTYKVQYVLSEFVDKYKDNKIGYLLEIESKYDIENMNITLRVPNNTYVLDADIQIYGYDYTSEGHMGTVNLIVEERVSKDKPLIFLVILDEGIVDHFYELDMTSKELKSGINISQTMLKDSEKVRDYLEEKSSSILFIGLFRIVSVFTTIILPLLLIIVPITFTLYLVYMNDMKGKAKIEGYTKSKIKEYNKDVKDLRDISKSYILLQNCDCIKVGVAKYIRTILAIMIYEGKIETIDKQTDLIIKINDAIEETTLTKEEIYLVSILRKISTYDEEISILEFDEWVKSNEVGINLNVAKIEKSIKKQMEKDGLIKRKYITIKGKDILRMGRNYQTTEEGVKLLDEVVGLYNYLTDMHILNDKIEYKKEKWDNYMIWATLFGEEKNVKTYLRGINKSYFTNQFQNIGYIIIRIYNSLDL